MHRAAPPKDEKSALQAHKEKILQELKYYEKRVKDFQETVSSKIYYEDRYSSDSDDDFPVLNAGPSLLQLKLQKCMLQTCLQATQELTSLQVVQSEVNVMVQEPVLEGEPPVSEPGDWREVTADCRIDLVPFAITFCVHKPHRKFAPPSYRCLKVLPVKNAHEAELSKSVLPGVTRPSDATEVIRSYADAYRSRRTTLARLADKFASNLFMEPMAEGGYMLKCADLLEVSWRLENKWSPVAAFHHKMKFDLEFMDESYIKIISQAHKQLSDPSIETDERTLLLAKIITTCLEAQGPTQKLYESMESDPETKKLDKRRTTLDEEVEAPAPKKRKEDRDNVIMAPPKSLPKKVKPKGKENMNDNRKLKRALDDVNVNVARNGAKRQSISDMVEAMSKRDDNEKEKDINHVDNEKNIERNNKNKAVNEKNKRNDINNTAKNKEATENCSKIDLNENEKLKDNLKTVTEINCDQNATNNAKKLKNKLYGNKVTRDTIKKAKNSIPSAKNADDNQEENGKKKSKPVEPQKAEENSAASTKNVKTKEPTAEKIGKGKVANSNKPNNDKNIDDKNQKEVTEKTVASVKNDQRTKESKASAAKKDRNKGVCSKDIQEHNPKSATDKAQNGETRIQNNLQTNKNVDKQSTKDGINGKVTKDQKINQKKNTKDSVKAKDAEKKIDSTKKVSKENDKSVKPTTKLVNKDVQKDAHKDINKDVNNDVNKDINKGINKGVNKDTNKDTNKDVNKDINKGVNKDVNKDIYKGVNKDINQDVNKDIKKDANNRNLNKKTVRDKTSKLETNEKIPENSSKKQKTVKSHKDNTEQMPKKIVLTKNIEKSNALKKSSNKDIINVKAKTVNIKSVDPNKAEINNREDVIERSVNVKNVASRNKEYVADVIQTVTSDEKSSKPKKIVIKNLSHNNPIALNKLQKKAVTQGNTGRSSNTEKNVKTVKTSKIPQKMSPYSESALPRNRLRISPRKIPSTFKSVSDSNLKRKTKKLATNIPRLVKNTEVK